MIIKKLSIIILSILFLCSAQTYNIDYINSHKFSSSIQYCKNHHIPFYIINFVSDDCIEVFDNDTDKSSIYKSIKQIGIHQNRYVFIFGKESQLMEDFIYHMSARSRYVYLMCSE